MREATQEHGRVTRHIYLIRHGQYRMEGDKDVLTELGRKQAKMTGMRLVSMPVTFKSLVYRYVCVRMRVYVVAGGQACV